MKKTAESKKSVLVMAVAVFLLAAALALNAYVIFKENRDSSAFVKNAAKDHPYLDPFQEFYDNSDLLINMRPLKEKLSSILYGKKAVVYFEYLNTGANISINGDTPFFPGSLMKIPVAMAVMEKIDKGEWSLNSELILTDADKNPNYGSMYETPSGTRFTVEDLLKKLLVDSDDTARQIFIRNVGQGEIEDVLTYLGMEDVVNKNLEINAKRYSNFWRAFYTASYLSANSSEELLKIMDLPHDEKLLRNGIPTSVNFSHKIGVYGDIYSDSGIIYLANRPYILTVMAEGDRTSAEKLMTDVSKAIYQYVAQN